MATSYPTALDALTNPSGSDAMNGAQKHSDQHGNANDAIEALEAKVGVNSSTAMSSLDYLVRNAPGRRLGFMQLSSSSDVSYGYSSVAWQSPWGTLTGIIVPPSGIIRVAFEGVFHNESNYGAWLGVGINSSSVASGFRRLRPDTNNWTKHYEVTVSGLTAGNSVNITPLIKAQHSSYTCYIYYGLATQPDTVTAQTSTNYGPATVDIYAA